MPLSSEFKGELYTALVTRIWLSVFSTIVNGLVVYSATTTKDLRNQHNLLLVNLAASDTLMGVAYFWFSLWDLANPFHHSRGPCLLLMFPIIWATYATVCSVVPVAYYRIKLIKAYRTEGYANIAEPWVFRTSIILLWVVTLIAAASVIESNSWDEIPVCIMPLVASTQYNVSYFMFLTSIIGIVCFEYLKIIFSVVCSKRSTKSISSKWNRYVHIDRKVSGTILFTAGMFLTCWIPVALGTLYYLLPNVSPDSNRAHLYMHYAAFLPLVHSCVDPFVYSLSEEEFRVALLNSDMWYFLRTCRGRMRRILASRFYSQTCPAGSTRNTVIYSTRPQIVTIKKLSATLSRAARLSQKDSSNLPTKRLLLESCASSSVSLTPPPSAILQTLSASPSEARLLSTPTTAVSRFYKSRFRYPSSTSKVAYDNAAMDVFTDDSTITSKNKRVFIDHF